ncbi:MAG TPA: NAD(P)/FAD-dependent oxidoreductase [Polyangiaceae bacterium]|nr:NAD(P)/FAD-dependent oxidoreductase [Polyangiaceae bacterium]
MSRSLRFKQVLRALHLARFCNEQRVSTSVGMEMFAHKLSRRRFLLAGAAATAACADPGTGRDRAAIQMDPIDVGIVGGGLAGLICADKLRSWGVAATLHEANTRLGGRCWSLGNVFPGQVAERGGEFIDNGHKVLIGYANEFGLAREDHPKQPGDEAFYFDAQHFPEAAVVDEYRDFVDVMHDDLSELGAPTADSFSPADQALDLTNLAEYLDSRGAGPVIRTALDVAYTIEYGLEIAEQSCLNLLMFIHADKRSRFQPFGVFSNERYHVIGGNDGIVQGIAARLTGPIHFGRKLVKVKKLSDGRIELTFKQGNTTIVAQHEAVVLALPFSTLRDVDLDASLAIPPWKQLAIDNFGYGTNAKLMLGFNGRPWLAQGSNGTAYTDLPYLQNSWETNPTNANSTRAVITDYTGGNLGASLNPNNPQLEAERFLANFDTVYPGAAAQATRLGNGQLRVHLEHWPSSPFVKGSYTCNPPGYFTTMADNEAKPIGNLYFAGEHTSSFYEWQGFMEGAATSGLRAADEIRRDF